MKVIVFLFGILVGATLEQLGIFDMIYNEVTKPFTNTDDRKLKDSCIEDGGFLWQVDDNHYLCVVSKKDED